MDKSSAFELEGDHHSEQQISDWVSAEEYYHNHLPSFSAAEVPSYSTADFRYEWYLRKSGAADLLSKNNIKVLDFGCADGESLAAFAPTISYFGVDVAESLLPKAKAQWPKGKISKIARHDQLPFGPEFFHGMVSFGVLHHIPNVSNTLIELNRVLKKNAFLILLDPITDMTRLDGTRLGLSPRERGIPPIYYLRNAEKLGFEIVRLKLGGLGGLNQLYSKLKHDWQKKLLMHLDNTICSRFSPFSIRYSRRSFFQKFAPTFSVVILRKR